MVEDRDILVEEEKSIADFFAAIKRRKKLGLFVASGIFLVGAVVTFLWPNTYTSTATILIEEPEVPVALIQTTVTTYGSRQIQTISQRVMTRSNLASIIEKFDLFPEKRKYTPTLLLTDEVQERIKIDLVNIETTDPARGTLIISTIAFTVGFEYNNPSIARQVANELVSLFLEENVRTRTVQTVETSQFLNREAERLGAEILGIETQLAKFKEDNEGSLPDVSELNLQLMMRVDADLLDVDRQLQSIEESKLILDSQLLMTEPSTQMVLPNGTVVASPEDQLVVMQTQLAVLEGRYNARHPDVVRLRRDVEALKSDSGISGDLAETTASLAQAEIDLTTARERYGSEHPEVRSLERMIESLRARADSIKVPSDQQAGEANNPTYIQIRTNREALDIQKRGLLQKQQELRSRLADFEMRLLRAPQVERELAGLQRSLSTATSRYYTMSEKLFGAEMGESLETQSKGERFTLVEPPNQPLEPSSPNRVALLLLLLIISPAFSLGAIAFKESLDDAICSPKAVLAVQGSMPIAEIPVLTTQENADSRARLQRIGLIATPVTLLLLLTIIHFAVKPLDVFWYTVLRKLGM